MRSRSQIQQWWCFLVNMRRLEKLFLLCRGKTSRGQYCHWKWHFPSKAWKMVTQQQIIKCKEMIKNSILFVRDSLQHSTLSFATSNTYHSCNFEVSLENVQTWKKMMRLPVAVCIFPKCCILPDIWKVIRFSVVFILLLKKKTISRPLFWLWQQINVQLFAT